MGSALLCEPLQTGGGCAESAGYVDQVAGPGAGAEQRPPAGDRADEDDVSDGDWRLGEVATGKRGSVGVCQGEEAVEEAVYPGAGAAGGPGQLTGETQREKGGDGACAHGGQIAESAGETAVADGFGGVPVKLKVTAGDGEVGCDGQLFAGPDAEEGAVVADAQPHPGGGTPPGAIADLVE